MLPAMDFKTMLKALLPGLIPVLVFVVADALFGEVVGLVVGLATGIGEFAFTLIKNRKADPFVAADTILLAVAGGLSLVLRNEIFFKLKPAVIEAVLAVSLAVLLVLPPSVLKGWLSSQLRGIALPDSALPMMKRSLLFMLGVLAVHIALTVWAALSLSNAAWGFISGGLLYILFGVVVLAQFISVRLAARAARQVDMLPLVDDTGRILQSLPAVNFHAGPGKLHPAVHLIITDGAGRLYFRRPVAAAGRGTSAWDSALATHVHSGETIESALAREMGRQLGVLLPPQGGKTAQPLLRYKWEDARESELVFSFILSYTGPFALDRTTIEEGRFWSREQIREAVGKAVFTPQLEFELGLVERMAAQAPNAALTPGPRP
jgi:intracellular septation protein A/isopentenyldiphosphate isomerase